MAQAVLYKQPVAHFRALRETEDRKLHVRRGSLPETVHVLRFGHSVLCNPTGLRDNKMCAVGFPSRRLLQSIKEVLNHECDIASISTDDLLNHVEQLQGIDGVFQIRDCYCDLHDRTTFYKVAQLENDGEFVSLSERTVQFDNDE